MLSKPHIGDVDPRRPHNCRSSKPGPPQRSCIRQQSGHDPRRDLLTDLLGGLPADLLICRGWLFPGRTERRCGRRQFMKLPVDTSAIAFLCAMAPEPVIDFQTKQHRADENGELLYVIQLLAMGDGSADLLAVKVPGVPSQAIRQGHPVKVSGLVAQPWTMNDRSGVAFRAARVEPVVAQAKAS